MTYGCANCEMLEACTPENRTLQPDTAVWTVVTERRYDVGGCSVQDVQQQIEEAKESKAPPIEDLWNNIYQDPMVAISARAVW